MSPVTRVLMAAVMVVWVAVSHPEDRLPTMACRCSALHPSNLGAEPRLKDLIPFFTWSRPNCMGGVSRVSGSDSLLSFSSSSSWLLLGCLDQRVAVVSSNCSAILVEDRAWDDLDS